MCKIMIWDIKLHVFPDNFETENINIPRAMIFVNFVSTFEWNFVRFELVGNFRYFLGHTFSGDEFELELLDVGRQQMLVFLI